ncbi:hypothetical protein [Peribacillus frigoritolerans]
MFLKQDLLTFMAYFFINETYIGLKKFATLLPNNWLAETPQALAPRRLADSRRKGSGFLKSIGPF